VTGLDIALYVSTGIDSEEFQMIVAVLRQVPELVAAAGQLYWFWGVQTLYGFQSIFKIIFVEKLAASHYITAPFA